MRSVSHGRSMLGERGVDLIANDIPRFGFSEECEEVTVVYRDGDGNDVLTLTVKQPQELKAGWIDVGTMPNLGTVDPDA